MEHIRSFIYIFFFMLGVIAPIVFAINRMFTMREIPWWIVGIMAFTTAIVVYWVEQRWNERESERQ